MTEVLILVVAGILAGAINAVAGGGAILIFPLLLRLGVDPIVATATISLAVLPGLLGSLIGYRKDLYSVPRSFLLLIIPVLVGASIGAFSLARIDSDLFSNIVPWLVLSAVLLLIFQAKIHHMIITEKHLVKTDRRLSWLGMIALVFFLSVYGGFFGVGVGIMLLAVVGLSSQMKNMYQLSALKNWYVTGIALVALSIFIWNGLINFEYGTLLAIGTLLGGYTGAKFSRHVPSHTVHNIAVILGVLIVIYLFVN